MYPRRSILKGLAALPLAGLPTSPSFAQKMLGTATLTTVSDGSLVLPGTFVFGQLAPNDVQPILAQYGASSARLTPECNLALYQDGTHTVLFDCGSGPDFMTTAGKVSESLDAANVTRADITHVIFTHAHPDHIWGLLDDFDEPLFPQATYMMGRAEWDYWWHPETVHRIGEARAAFAVGAKRRMAAIEDAVHLLEDEEEVLPGITAIATPGHTPGHMAFEVRNGGEAALIVGDAIGNHHVAFHRPEWESGADQDATQAVATRLMLFDRLTTEDLTVVGFHLPNGGMGRVERGSDGYRFIQI